MQTDKKTIHRLEGDLTKMFYSLQQATLLAEYYRALLHEIDAKTQSAPWRAELRYGEKLFRRCSKAYGVALDMVD